MAETPTRQSGAERASRIQLQYYKGWDRRAIGRAVAATAALLLTLGYVLYGVIGGDASKAKYSRGPISAAHASFENNCSMCHDTDVAGDRIHANAFFWSDESRQSAHGTITKKCTQCHKTGDHLSPEMHSKGHDDLSCTACHGEHRGRQFNPATVDDHKCTKCHEKSVGEHPSVTAFRPNEHPEFFRVHRDETLRDEAHPDREVPLKDPGNVKFNHELHLRPGIYNPDSTVVSNHAMKWLDIPEFDVNGAELRARFSHSMLVENGQQIDVVTLSCVDCHEAGKVQTAGKTMKSDKKGTVGVTHDSMFGDDMPPIRFEQHCRACHPLSVGKGVRLEHGVSLSVINESIDNTFGQSLQAIGHLSAEAATALEQAETKESESVVDELSELAKSKLEGHEDEDKNRALMDELENLIKNEPAPLRRLRLQAAATCLLCHDESSLWASNHSEDTATTSRSIVPPPRGWLKFGYFPHVRHDGVSCETCHTTSSQSKYASDVALLAMQSKCFQCHRSDAKANSTGSNLTGPVAGSNCADCHSYHRARLDWQLDSELIGPTSYEVIPKEFLKASGASSKSAAPSKKE